MFYGPGQQAFIPNVGRGGMPFTAGQAMGMPGMPGRPGQFPGAFPGQQGGRGMGPNQQIPPNFAMGAQGMPMGVPNGMNYPQAMAQVQTFGRGGGRGMQGMPPQGMRGPGAQGYQPRGVPMQGRPGQGGRGQGASPMPAPAMPQGGPAPGGLTLQALNAVPVEQQKQMLGEALYPKIHAQQPELAGKITGMLLEMDNTELITL